MLPPDDSAYGFDNISDALNVSPSLQERYLAAAEKIGELAFGDPEMGTLSETYHVRGDVSQNQHIDGMPLGTLGGTRVNHFFPRDGEYVFQTRLFRTNFDNPRGIEYPQEFELTLDGERVHHATIGGPADLEAAFERPKEAADAIDERLGVRIKVSAGPRDVVAAFIGSAPTVDSTKLRPFLKSAFDTLDWTGRPHIRTLTITGPFNATGPGDTPTRRRIFTCRPASAATEEKCAKADHRDAGSSCVPGARHRDGLTAASELLSGRPEGRQLRYRHRARAATDSGEPEVRLSHRARSREPGTWFRVPGQRHRAGLSALILSVEQHPGR